jgi:hypothetical protein
VPVNVLGYTVDRVHAALNLARDLEASEFPQPYCKEGIQLIAERFQEREKFLKSIGDKRDLAIVRATCRGVLDDLFDLLPILGFFLRSTNVRNAFELHGPLARIAEQLVPGIKLVISSEWDFSPHSFFGYPPVATSLPNFVLIGLPASESANALVLPLAGHELGHAVWTHKGLKKQFDPRVTQALLKEIEGRWPEYKKQFPQVKRYQP